MAEMRPTKQEFRATPSTRARQKRDCPRCGEYHNDLLLGSESVLRRCKRCKHTWALVCDQCDKDVVSVEERMNVTGHTFLRAVCACGNTRPDWNVQKPNGNRQRRQRKGSPEDAAMAELADLFDDSWRDAPTE